MGGYTTTEISDNSGKLTFLTEEQIQQICHNATTYLTSSKAYLRPDLSLAMLAQEVKIPQRNLSQAINRHLKCNFFTYINLMRIEEAKRLLLDLDASGYTIDSISTECGFNSRSTFFLVFKKLTGKSPATWLKNQKRGKKIVFSQPFEQAEGGV